MTDHEISRKLAQEIFTGKRTKEQAKATLERIKRFRGMLKVPTETNKTFLGEIFKNPNPNITVMPREQGSHDAPVQTLEILKYVVLFEHRAGRHWNELYTDVPLKEKGDPQIEEMLKVLLASGLEDLQVIKIIWEA